MTTPQLDVDAGAVSDTSGNAVSATSDQTITIQDTIKPTFSSASYKTGEATLKITFSEALDSSKHVATKFHIRESGQSSGGVTLSNGTITANGTSSLTVTLSTAGPKLGRRHGNPSAGRRRRSGQRTPRATPYPSHPTRPSPCRTP